MGKIRHAAGAVEAAAQNANFLIVQVIDQLEQAKAQGYLEVEVDLVDNPQLEAMAKTLGFEELGTVNLKIKLPQPGGTDGQATD